MSAKPESDTDKLERRNHELSILNAIAEALNREVDLSQALDAALAQVAELLGLRTGWVWLLREETGESYLAAAQNLPPALANSPHRMEGRCYCLDTYRAGDLDGAANVNVVTCSRLRWLVDGTEGLRYHASIPLYAHGKQLGVMNVASPDWRELSPDDLSAACSLGPSKSATGWPVKSPIRWRRGWPPSRCNWRPPTPCWRRGPGPARLARRCSKPWP
jgi:two-component system NarL family sensor kinase